MTYFYCSWIIRNPDNTQKFVGPQRVRINRISIMDLHVKYNDQFHEAGEYGNNDAVSLRIGAPGKFMLTKCIDIMKRATCDRLDQERENGYLFQYGASLGDWSFRKNLAEFLSQHYKANVNLENLMATGGASHGLYLTASLYFGRDCLVFVEDPTYFLALKVFKNDFNMNVIPIPMDSEGINVDILEKKLKECNSLINDKLTGVKSKFRAMVYLIPAYHNPTGICYSPDRCKQLVDVAIKHNLLLVCDDVYNLLHYQSDEPPKPLVLYEEIDNKMNSGHVISNGTFSKIFGPGLRLGWIQASQQILEDFRNLGLIVSGGNFQYMSGVMSNVLEKGYQKELLAEAKEVYLKRTELLSKILKEKLPAGCTFTNPEGGYFIWIVLPKHIKAEDFHDWLKENYSVIIHPGNRCSAAGNFTNCIRISFTYHEEKVLIEAVNRLCKGLAIYLEKHCSKES